MKTLTKDLILEQMELDEMNDHSIAAKSRFRSVAEQRYIIKIENHLGFSLNDKDARAKLNHLSKIIRIPDILYQYAA